MAWASETCIIMLVVSESRTADREAILAAFDDTWTPESATSQNLQVSLKVSRHSQKWQAVEDTNCILSMALNKGYLSTGNKGFFFMRHQALADTWLIV